MSTSAKITGLALAAFMSAGAHYCLPKLYKSHEAKAYPATSQTNSSLENKVGPAGVWGLSALVVALPVLGALGIKRAAYAVASTANLAP